MEDVIFDLSPWIRSDWMSWQDLPELWVDKIYEGYYEEGSHV